VKGENGVMMGMDAAAVAGGFVPESGHCTAVAGSCLELLGEGTREKRLEESTTATGFCLEPLGKGAREKRGERAVDGAAVCAFLGEREEDVIW
jgi:hypothetical protein